MYLERNRPMHWTQILWDPMPDGNVEHVEEHDLTTDEVDYTLTHYESKTVSRSSGRSCIFGYTPDGRYITVVYEEEGDTIIPVTAYDVPEP
jgi:uncharacterized DUF497 family protein